MRAAVFGGYGTFGSLVSRELARLGLEVVVAGRDGARAAELAANLPGSHRGVAADVTAPTSVRAVLEDVDIAVNAAGPFSQLGTTLLDACLERRRPYADIADDRAYVAHLRTFDARFREAGVTAVTGCSSLPGISGALALLAQRGRDDAPERARVALLIGNRNPKGRAAIQSLVQILGRPIAAPQGVVRGFGDREVITFPPPYGERAAFNFESPEYDLFPALLGVRAVSVKVGFELRSAAVLLRTLSRVSLRNPARAARWLERLGRFVGRLGTSGGAVTAELFYADGSWRRAALSSPTLGQRLAALPCALAAHALARGTAPRPGVLTAYELLDLLPALEAEGFALTTASG